RARGGGGAPGRSGRRDPRRPPRPPPRRDARSPSAAAPTPRRPRISCRPPARFYSRCLAPSEPIVYRGGAQEAPMWIALVVVLAALGVPALASAQPGATLVVGLAANPVNLHPAQVTDPNPNRGARPVVETPVTFPDESTQLVPGLAESWTVSRDGLHYPFKLRRGVVFHDGTP